MQVYRTLGKTTFRNSFLWKDNINNLCRMITKPYNSCSGGMKVTICGAAGKTDIIWPYSSLGQPLAVLLKQSPLLDKIALYDVKPTCGHGMELSHVDTKCEVASYTGRDMLCEALKDCKVVVIVVCNDCDSFENNAPAIVEIALQICNTCPTAFTIVATNPVESMVPLVEEVQRLRGCYDPKKLSGCVELNCVRANTVLSDFLKVAPEKIRVPVIGGTTPQTMVPVLSAGVNTNAMTQEQVECLTSCIMGGTQAVKTAKGGGSASPNLAGAYAIARNTLNVVKGLKGTKVMQCAYVDHLMTCVPDCQFFSNEVMLGPTGIEKNLGIPEVTKFENCLLCNCLPHVQNEIKRAIYLIYTMCTTQQYPECSGEPANCFHVPQPPCLPHKSAPKSLDNTHHKYLATICREMSCKCGSTELVWSPRGVDYDAMRASSFANQTPASCDACPRRLPKSVRMGKQLQKNNRPENCK